MLLVHSPHSCREVGPRGDKGDGRPSPGPWRRVDIHRLVSNLRTERYQVSCREDECDGASLVPTKTQDTQWYHLAGGLQQWHRLILGVISLSHLEAENPPGLGGENANNSNPYNLIVMSKLAMKIWDGFSLPQTGTLSKIDPHAKPFWALHKLAP